MALLELNDNNFDENINNKENPVLVDFWAPWCGPCQMMAPVLESLAQKLADKLVIAKINTDNNQDTASKYQITGIPCLILFKNGQEITRFVGFRPEQALEADILNNI